MVFWSVYLKASDTVDIFDNFAEVVIFINELGYPLSTETLRRHYHKQNAEDYIIKKCMLSPEKMEEQRKANIRSAVLRYHHRNKNNLEYRKKRNLYSKTYYHTHRDSIYQYKRKPIDYEKELDRIRAIIERFKNKLTKWQPKDLDKYRGWLVKVVATV